MKRVLVVLGVVAMVGSVAWWSRAGEPPAPADKVYDIQISVMKIDTSGEKKLLTQPRLRTLAGRTATVQIGGEIPVPNDSNEISYRSVGTRLTVTVSETNQAGKVALDAELEVTRPIYADNSTADVERLPITFEARHFDWNRTVKLGRTVKLTQKKGKKPAGDRYEVSLHVTEVKPGG